MGKAIVITSGKGGVGKTTLTVTAGKMLAEMGKRVALIDADIGLNNLDVLFGVENRVVYDLVDVVQNRCRVSQALIPISDTLNLLPSVHTTDFSSATGQSLRAIVLSLATRHDFVLIDCPAGIEKGFHRAVAAADEAIVVTTPHASAVSDARKVIDLLAPYHLNRTSLIINRTSAHAIKRGEQASPLEIARLLDTRLLAVMPDTAHINALSSLSAALPTRSESYRAAKLLAQAMLGIEHAPYGTERGIFRKIFNKRG